jgi:hypothetical protein
MCASVCEGRGNSTGPPRPQTAACMMRMQAGMQGLVRGSGGGSGRQQTCADSMQPVATASSWPPCSDKSGLAGQRGGEPSPPPPSPPWPHL